MLPLRQPGAPCGAVFLVSADWSDGYWYISSEGDGSGRVPGDGDE